MAGLAMTGADEDRLQDLLKELRTLRDEGSQGNLEALVVKLRRIARRYLPGQSALRSGLDSEDLAHEGLLQLIQRVDDFRGSTMAEFLAFAKAVVGQQAIRQARRQSVRRRELRAREQSTDHAVDTRTPSADAAHQEDRRRLQQLLETLSDEHRSVLQQRLNGLSNAEIAATLGLREDLVRKRLSRALKELKHRW